MDGAPIAQWVDAPVPEVGDGAVAGRSGGGWERRVGTPRRRVSRLVTGLAVGSVGALFAAVLVSMALAWASDNAGDRSDVLAAGVVDALDGRRATEAVQAGLFGLAAASSGTDVITGGEVRTRLGELRAVQVPPRYGSVTAYDRADRARDAYATTVADMLDRAGADPRAVGAEVPALRRTYRDAVRGWSALASSLAEQASQADRRADTFRLFSRLALIPGIVASAILLGLLGRRLRHALDEPIDEMRRSAVALIQGDLEARSGLTGPTDVLALGEELDTATDALQRQVRRLRLHAEWGAQSRMIFEALDLADEESEAHGVAQQALGIIDAGRPAELLLAPHGSTELTSVAVNPNQPGPGCPVDEVSGCVAIRRAQPVVFDSSESINACPKLRNRPYGPCSAACVPVSVAGRPVGVLHAVAADRHPPEERTVSQLATLATQLGNRLGALRALESSRHEAATDKLTGLPNRRLLESQIASLIERSTPFVLVLADLDKFKVLNDSFGHEVGDRALQLFAQVLRDKVRGNDVIARLGGEEFVLVYPNMSVTTSIEAIERVRDGLAQALAVSQIPDFSCSFGITHSAVGRSGDAILRVADAGLLRAKELGGDQVVYADETLAARVFGDDDGAGRSSTR